MTPRGSSRWQCQCGEGMAGCALPSVGVLKILPFQIEIGGSYKLVQIHKQIFRQILRIFLIEFKICNQNCNSSSTEK